MSSGGDTPTWNRYEVDQKGLAEFMQSENGQQYSGRYNPTSNYFMNGNTIQAVGPGGSIDPFAPNLGTDVSEMMRAYQSWVLGNQQTKVNWENYSKTVAANEGGQGDNTITLGAAVGQRQALLGALANAGNPIPASSGGVTPPTVNPGLAVGAKLGSMAYITQTPSMGFMGKG